MVQTTPDASFGPVFVAAAQPSPLRPFKTPIEPYLRPKKRLAVVWARFRRRCPFPVVSS
jgi:hypothetical protein